MDSRQLHESRLRASGVRDVGVAGSNPVTPTIDFPDFFPAALAPKSPLGNKFSGAG